MTNTERSYNELTMNEGVTFVTHLGCTLESLDSLFKYLAKNSLINKDLVANNKSWKDLDLGYLTMLVENYIDEIK